jgi:ribonuclease D
MGRVNPNLPSALPPEILRRISHEEMVDLPIRRYEGEVRLVETPADLESALADIMDKSVDESGAASVVGFDTETRPAFRKGESYLPCLAQVATARAVYLFQLQRRDWSAPMAELLASERIAKAGVSLADDLRNLKKLFAFEEKAIVDVGMVARRHGLKQTGVRNLAGIFLGFRIPKGTKTSNWAAPRLSPQQILYAATDAWACRELYLCFRKLGLL